MSRRARLILHPLLAMAGLIACGPTRPPSFVVVVVDTLRLDRLHFAGYGEPHTPVFDRLQSESVWFRRAWTTSSWTLPSVASLLLSQYPSEHGVSYWGSKLGSRVSLPGHLRRAGYATALFTSNCLLSRDRGFHDHFEHYELIEGFDPDPPTDGLCSPGEGKWVTSSAMAWLRRVRSADPEQPIFAHLHLMEPHTPYRCPEEAGNECRRRARRLARKLRDFDWDFSAEQKAQLHALYAADVARADSALGDLWARLEAEDALDDAWLVVLSDHGELLGERSLYLHGRTLYQPLVSVPMLFRPPGGGRGHVVDVPTSLVDVAPTLAELAGLAEPASFRGRSLAAALRGEELAPRPVVAEILHHEVPPRPPRRHKLAATDGRWKYLVEADGALSRIDLEADPAEQHPQPARSEDLERLLAAAGMRLTASGSARREVPEPTPEMLERLRSLGYAPE